MSETKQITKSLGTFLRNIPAVEQTAQQFKTSQTYKSDKNNSIPKQLNGVEIWRSYLSPVMAQNFCGNCWSYSLTSMLADRFALMSLGQIKFIPSPADMTICSHNFSSNIENEWQNPEFLEKDQVDFLANRSCNGNTLFAGAEILFQDGCSDLSCFPLAQSGNPSYDIPSCEDSRKLPSCTALEGREFDTCPNSKRAMRKYRALTCYNVAQNEKAIMSDIFRYGPLSSGFMVFPDFMDYDGTTIYTHPNRNSDPAGGHAILIVGFGEEMQDGRLVKYWWIKNSWGKEYGLNGFFRMERNLADCELEKNCLGLLPDFPGMQILDSNLVPIETEEDIKVRMFTGHFLDSITGYYTTAIAKIKSGELQGDLTPILDPNARLPDYATFYAGLINEFKSQSSESKISLPISNKVFANVLQAAGLPVSKSFKSVNNVNSSNNAESSSDVTKSEKPTYVIEISSKTVLQLCALIFFCIIVYKYKFQK